MSVITEVKEKLDQWRKDGIKILQEQSVLLKQYLVTCVYYKKQNPISSWIFVQAKYYVRPRGCTEGDYWADGKTEICTLMCPECTQGNYLYNHPQKSEIVDLTDSLPFSKKNIFKDVREEMCN